MTVGEAQRHGQEKLQAAGIESARLDVNLLLEKLMEKPRSWLLAHEDDELEETVVAEFLRLTEQRARRVPLVHLTHSREFYGLDLYIDDGVLTPRVETEKMVEYAVRHAPKHSRLIDIGTGSGALAIAIKTHRPDLETWATDVTDEALAVAKKNAKAYNVNVKFIRSNLFDRIEGRFETVVTNLPYLRDDARGELMPEVKKEPAVALFGGVDGLDLYRRFLQQLPAHLAPAGFLFTECDPWQHEALMKTAMQAGLRPIEKDDYFILGFQNAD
ncbi:MAG TPA: peptide chain release factor N(5)-glutamine methyltransferase [Candidatus Saccharimonadales bacterium]|nr:peptide chain release factor N(5)-glutamine methyltransferase [Candidatus Saccharimonadales bacterium]